MNTNLKNYRDFIYIIIIGIFLFMYIKQRETIDMLKNISVAKESNIEKEKRKDGSTINTITPYVTDYKTFKSLPNKSESEKKIVDETDKGTQSSVYLEGTSEFKFSVPKKDSARYTTPWIDFKMNQLKDSIQVSLNIKEKYIVNIQEKGLFNKYIVVDVISYNPLTKVNTVSSFVKKKKKDVFTIGPAIGIGLSSDLTFKPFIGISIQYVIFRI